MLKASWKRWCQSYKISFFWIFSMLKKRLVILIHWLHEWRGRRSEGSSICFEGIDLDELWRAGCKPPGAKSFVMETARLRDCCVSDQFMHQSSDKPLCQYPLHQDLGEGCPHTLTQAIQTHPSPLSLFDSESTFAVSNTDKYCKCFRIHRDCVLSLIHGDHYGSMLLQLRSRAWDAEPDQEDDGLEP